MGKLANPQGHPPLPSRRWAFFLDVDGTLLEIASRPSAVRVDDYLLELIERLRSATGNAVALVSGRSLSDLDNLLGLRRMPMAGQHGLERRDASGRLWLHSAPPLAKQSIIAGLATIMAEHQQLLLEDKGLVLALHYRMAPHLGPRIRRLMNRLASAAGPGITVQCGRRVVEVKPSGVDKGTSLLEFLDEPPFKNRLPVFIGDDLSDENAFLAVNQRNGISVKVGKAGSCAHYRLRDVLAVRQWLSKAVSE
jgi:trehalose 6-phosphate phosphatase